MQLKRKSEFSTQTNLKEYVETFRKMKQGKYDNKPPDGVGKLNILENVEDASCRLMLGIPKKHSNDFSSP